MLFMLFSYWFVVENFTGFTAGMLMVAVKHSLSAFAAAPL